MGPYACLTLQKNGILVCKNDQASSATFFIITLILGHFGPNNCSPDSNENTERWSGQVIVFLLLLM